MSGRETLDEQERRYERNRRNPPRPKDLDPEYVKHYRRGRRASSRLGAVAPLEAAMSRGEPDAWHHGYTDAAAGDPMWTRVPDSARMSSEER